MMRLTAANAVAAAAAAETNDDNEGDDDDGTPVGVIAIQKEDIGECCYPHVYRIFCDV